MILVTGATGFVGGALTRRLAQERPGSVRAALRRGQPSFGDGVQMHLMDDLRSADWDEALRGVATVVHTAARVHVMRDAAPDLSLEYREVNVDATMRLANAAAAAGVRRFVFVSTIKVHGEGTLPGRPYMADDKPAPQDAYAVSKWEAELALMELARRGGPHVTVVRPPLVYGSGVKANFGAMLRWVARGVPLPFAAVRNQRSLIALDNLVDLLLRCIDDPGAANQTLLASDDEDVSTPELLRRVGIALGRPARLVPVPVSVLKGLGAVLGKKDAVERLCSSLQVDIGRTRRLLGWTPPIGLDEGLRRAVRGVSGPV